MLEFSAMDWFKVRDMDAAVVLNPTECSDFDHLIGSYVVIDKTVRRVRAVERFTHAAPWRAGEKISLLFHNAESAPTSQ